MQRLLAHSGLVLHSTHVPVPLQTSPPFSLHMVPSGSVGFEHIPVPLSQVPAEWHWSCAMHTTGFEPVQVPAWQVSVSKHGLPSLHADPSALFGFEHMPV